MSTFKKAQRSQVFIKLAVTGPTGSGKTYSSLRLANGLLEGTQKRIAFLDTENDSASLYSDRFDFDVLPIDRPFEHEKFIAGIEQAVVDDYGVVIIDSSSHFWEGILEYKSKLDSRGGNSYTNWNDAGKKFDGIISAVLQSKIHLIACMRSKMDYILEDNGKGKLAPKKVGLAPIMRDGIEYEFTTVFDVALDHQCQASKDRSGLFTDKIFQITEATGASIASWLRSATPKAQHPTHNEPQMAQKQPPEDAQPKDGDIVWEGIIADCRAREGTSKGKKWILYTVKMEDGNEASTFSETISNLAVDAGKEGHRVKVTVKSNLRKEGTFELLNVEVIGGQA